MEAGKDYGKVHEQLMHEPSARSYSRRGLWVAIMAAVSKLSLQRLWESLPLAGPCQ